MPPRARNTDPATSHAAAASVSDLTPRQEAVLKALVHIGGMATDEVLVTRYYEYGRMLDLPEQAPSGIRTRRKELVEARRVHDSGSRERLESGRYAIVWAIGPPDAITPAVLPIESDEELF